MLNFSFEVCATVPGTNSFCQLQRAGPVCVVEPFGAVLGLFHRTKIFKNGLGWGVECETLCLKTERIFFYLQITGPSSVGPRQNQDLSKLIAPVKRAPPPMTSVSLELGASSCMKSSLTRETRAPPRPRMVAGREWKLPAAHGAYPVQVPNPGRPDAPSVMVPSPCRPRVCAL